MPSSDVRSLLIASFHDLTCIQGFKVLSEAERTAALYSLLQHSTHVQAPLLHRRPATDGQADPITAL